MKHFYQLFFLFIAILFASCSKEPAEIPVNKISISETTITLKVGQTETLSATVSPDDATDKTVTWTSSDNSIASVKDGVVTAIKLGTATITAKAGDKTATCSVTVAATPVTNVMLNKTSVELKVGQTETLSATVSPDDATDKTVTWTSSDNSIASVKDGVVTAIKLGTATITAKAGDKTATCSVTVYIPKPSGNQLDIDGNANCYIIAKGGTYYFTPTAGPTGTKIENISKVSILWESDGLTSTISENTILQDVQYQDGYIVVKTNLSTDGNAVIAAYDADNIILWSWHIWCYYGFYPNNESITNSGTTLMNVNIGAIGANNSGLLYQPDRKDPFPGSSNNKLVYATHTKTTYPASTSNQCTEYTNSHPMVFLTNCNELTDSKWDASVKQPQDPCPAGWIVSDVLDEFWDLTTFPITGYLSSTTGDLTMGYNNCIYGRYWPNYFTMHSNNNHQTYHHYDGQYNDSEYKGIGLSVRCKKL